MFVAYIAKILTRLKPNFPEGGRMTGYWIQPDLLQKHPAYQQLDLPARAVFRDLMDYVCQHGENGEDCIANLEDLARYTGVDLKNLESALTRLMADTDTPLLEVLPDIRTGGMRWRLPLLALSKELEVSHARAARRQERKAIQESHKKARGTLSSRVKERRRVGEDIGPTRIRCLDANEFWAAKQPSAQYCGWLPTSAFASRGQVYMVDDKVVANWASKLPGVDMSRALQRLWAWMMKDPKVRPRASYMSTWVIEQIKRMEEKRQEKRSTGSQLAINDHEAIEQVLDAMIAGAAR